MCIYIYIYIYINIKRPAHITQQTHPCQSDPFERGRERKRERESACERECVLCV